MRDSRQTEATSLLERLKTSIVSDPINRLKENARRRFADETARWNHRLRWRKITVRWRARWSDRKNTRSLSDQRT